MQGRPNDESKLSRNPTQIRRRLRRRHSKFAADLDMYLEDVYQKPIEEWDLQELARGRPRSKDGTFKGRTPAWLSPAVTKEAKRRLLEHTFGELAGHVDQAVKAIGDLITSDEVDDNGKPLVDARTRLEAAKFVIENLIGKPKAIIEVEAGEAVRQFLAGALVLDDGSPAHPVIDGQFEVDDEEVEDDDPPEQVPDVQPNKAVARRKRSKA
jgi:hypothetical protein